MATAIPLAVIPEGSSAATTLGFLGVASTIGMTVSAGVLVLLVRGAWGAGALAGSGRTLGAAVVGVALSLAVGDALAHQLQGTSLWSALASGLTVAVVTIGVYLVAMLVGDRSTMNALRERGRRRRRGAQT
jgi:putative peptidoglycan lipid II flippase